MFADMQHAEHRSEVEGRWGKLDIWKQFPNRPDNEGLDVLVGCLVAASIQGIGADSEPKKPKIKLSELYERKRRQIDAAGKR